MLSSAIASSYAANAESHDARRNHCSPRRKALSAGSEVEPMAVARKTPIRRVRPSSRSSRSVSESARRSMRSVASRSSISASGRSSATSNAVAVRRAESGPAPMRLPNTTRPAPVRWPSAAAEGRSARPVQRRITVVEGTLRTGPAPSRFRESTSTRPSRQSERRLSGTSNGATATRFASSGAVPRECRAMSHPATTAVSPATSASRTTGARRAVGGRGMGAVMVVATPSAGVLNDSSAWSSSPALCQRSAGRFSRQRITSAASAGGTAGRRVASGGGGCARWAATTACAVGPVKGGRPVRISYPRTPSA